MLGTVPGPGPEARWAAASGSSCPENHSSRRQQGGQASGWEGESTLGGQRRMRQHLSGLSGWLTEEQALSRTLKRLVELGQVEVGKELRGEGSM